MTETAVGFFEVVNHGVPAYFLSSSPRRSGSVRRFQESPPEAKTTYYTSGLAEKLRFISNFDLDRSLDPPPPTAGQPSPAKKRATSTVLTKAAAPGDLVSRVKPKITSTHRREAGEIGAGHEPSRRTTSPCRSAAESRRRREAAALPPPIPGVPGPTAAGRAPARQYGVLPLYYVAVRRLAVAVLQLLSETLVLAPDRLKEMGCMDNMSVVVSYYPPCHEPRLTRGTS
ncbi:hypothetical protein QYE76_023924 [Lolium multiflorum]|uniref:Uncharacterized protein n=1 Tax=Lolium multiflorum TaxID=4521 RepID=A0AAD8VSR9_LOLMU|nr:hypothetical protein QYE76_023924 [Lolium multiflorum]